MPQSKRRSTKRNRRAPVRRPVPVPEPGTAQKWTGQRRRFPSMLGQLASVPVEALPLYAALAVVHEEIATSTGPVNACVPVCRQLAGTLEHLGFTAEPMAAHVQIEYLDGNRHAGEVGVRTEPRTSADATTNGHMVLWSDDFGRLVDPTIVQAEVFLRASKRSPNLALPAVIPIPGGREQLVANTVAGPRPPFIVAWTVFPHWSAGMDAVLVGDLRAAMPYGALNLAHTTLDVVRTVAKAAGRDLAPLARYSRFAALLSGDAQLPALPDDPPAEFLRVRQAAGMAPPA